MSEEFSNFKEQVRDSADIVEVIAGYVSLKKRGHNHWGCCPFHGEKTPSFCVNAEKNMFYCFGCHEGGDVFNFIMKIENCSFVDAVKMLASRYGIAVPEKEKTAQEIRQEKYRAVLLQANELAERFFHACLLNTHYGEQALQYLRKRGITKQTIEKFSIGFAINNYSALSVSLTKRGCSQEALVKAGLCLDGRNNNIYDKFRNRVMIPIKDAKGRTVGFGGRVIDDSVPKYMNTGETELFNKRHLLFGFNAALSDIKKERKAVVVEGYMDAISLHAYGINNVVASMGTAFSEQQAKLIKRAADTVVFCYDSDNAGRRASVRAVSIAKSAGLAVKVAVVPNGKDPDEFVRNFGKDAFIKVINEAADGLDFQIDETISQNNVTNLAGKVDVVSNILPFLSECKSEIEVSAYIRKLAQKLTIDEGLISDEYRKFSKKRDVHNDIHSVQPVINKINSDDSPAERLLLAILLEHPDMADDCVDVVKEVGFVRTEYQVIFDAVLSAGKEDNFLERLSSVLDSESLSVLAGILAVKMPLGDSSAILYDCLKQMKKIYLQKLYEKHRLLADEYERSGDARFKDELMESQRIQYEIKKLYES